MFGLLFELLVAVGRNHTDCAESVKTDVLKKLDRFVGVGDEEGRGTITICRWAIANGK